MWTKPRSNTCCQWCHIDYNNLHSFTNNEVERQTSRDNTKSKLQHVRQPKTCSKVLILLWQTRCLPTLHSNSLSSARRSITPTVILLQYEIWINGILLKVGKKVRWGSVILHPSLVMWRCLVQTTRSDLNWLWNITELKTSFHYWSTYSPPVTTWWNLINFLTTKYCKLTYR